MDVLWSPWRYDYITSHAGKPSDCVFCSILQNSASDEENFILKRAEFNFVILNIYPYTSGHLMVLRYKLLVEISTSTKEVLDEMMDLVKTAKRDANLIIGLFSPFRHEIPEYLGYDITFFKDNIRFLEILGGREGGGGTICPLYFDGAVNYFKELPLPNDTVGIGKVKEFITKIKLKSL